jgi:1,4-dihydroxy-2-naphthoyl-CoA hydrolase
MFIKKLTLEQLNSSGIPTILTQLGIEFTEVGDHHLCGRMPVDHRTVQPYGLLHGGASVVLAETLGSQAGYMTLPEDQHCVGLEINANHLRSVTGGYVHGKAAPLHIGKNTHVWEIKITNDEGKLVCVSRITLAILHKRT